jgi:Rrf2 family protein
MINSRFTVAVHVLTLLAMEREIDCKAALTSERASGSVNTNPVVVRRIMGSLRKAGIVRSQPGPSGGWFLQRDPGAISLRDVYCAMEDEQLFSMHHHEPNHACPVGRNIQHALDGVFREAESAMEARLAESTIADLVAEVKDRVEARAG